MAKPGQSSFRRILLSRILLLSIPVLLTGEIVAYKKSRASLLETARQNLTESAIRKGENIRDLVEALRANMLTASEVLATQVDSPDKNQDFVNQMTRWFPNRVQCVQLTNLQTKQIEASSCGKQPISADLTSLWAKQSDVVLDRSSIRISQVQSTAWFERIRPPGQLNIVLNAPIYDRVGQLRYALSAQVALYRQEGNQPGSLSGATVVIDQNGTILAHPRANRLGRTIQQEADADRLQEVFKKAIAGQQDTLNLFSFEENGEEWLAGYSAIEIPVTAGEKKTWVVLAVTRLDSALYGLEEIKRVLVILTLGLVTANLLATLYLARDLVLPIEQLGDYAHRIYNRFSAGEAPKNFKIRELNQLSEALESMVDRLEERAEELEAAWQEAQEANQLKSEFLANTSHELRTPLNAIIGCLRLVKDGCCDDEQEAMDFLQQADDAAIHLLKIINDLLDLAKIEAGKVELSLQPVSIEEICHQCLKMVQPGAEKKHITLSLTLDPRLDRVPLDERRARQMVINLLSNAVKFTSEGGQVKLSGQLAYGYQLAKEMRPDHSPINPSTPFLCLEVIDSGIGIPPDRWHLLFRPFQQVDSSLTRKHEGTGLGLAFTKRLAELHGGTVSFQSVPGEGSTFRIWLPTAGSDGKSNSVAAAKAAVEEVSKDGVAYEVRSVDRPVSPAG